MNRSTLLLFFCVFALNEVILTAKMARIRGMVGRKNLSDVRLVRSTGCATDKKCEMMCKMLGGSVGYASDNEFVHCVCDDDSKTRPTIENCAAACKILGVGAGEVDSKNDRCFCRPWEICGRSKTWIKLSLT